MDCEEIREFLPLFAGGELGEGERVAVEAHLGFCAGCARELDRYRQARALLADLREGEPPPGTWKALWRGLEEGLSLGVPAGLRSRPSGAYRLAAALLVGLAVGLAAHAARREAAGPASLPAATVPALQAAVRGTVPTAAAADSPAALRPEAFTLRVRGGAVPVSPVPPKDRFHLPLVEAFPPPDEREF